MTRTLGFFGESAADDARVTVTTKQSVMHMDANPGGGGRRKGVRSHDPVVGMVVPAARASWRGGGPSSRLPPFGGAARHVPPWCPFADFSPDRASALAAPSSALYTAFHLLLI